MKNDNKNNNINNVLECDFYKLANTLCIIYK